MDSEEILPHLLEFLHDTRDKNIQFDDVLIGVLSSLSKNGLLGVPWNEAERDIIWGRGGKFSEEREKIREILWGLILERVISPGINDMNPNLPFFHLTEYGIEVVKHREVQPHDPDGYLKNLKNKIPSIDVEIERYVTESLQAYRRGLLLSSALTMGVASEKAFILLHEELTNSLTDPIKKKKYLDLQSSYKIKHKFDEVKKELMAHKSKYPRNISENLETHLDTIFQVIRVTRNEVGHPTGRILNRGEVFVRLQLFVEYTIMVYQLINWLRTHTL